jgi:8-oxo-dGTP pyrophosphatase MutT (NUDIX family)
MDTVPIKDAATVILMRGTGQDTRILMGQRGASAVFMPNKFVFPGGAVDAADADVPLAPLPPALDHALSLESRLPARAIAAAALRELREETGLTIGTPLPDPSALRLFFRAVTPPGRPRRFDARFLIASADHVVGDPDDFSTAEDELSQLQWIKLTDARAFELPFITRVVLGEVAQFARTGTWPKLVPFFRNDRPGTPIDVLSTQF